MDETNTKYLNIFYFLFCVAIIYKLQQIFLHDIQIYYRQYDVFGLLTDGFRINNLKLDFNQNLNFYKITSSIIFVLNMSSLVLLLKRFDLKFFSIFLICSIFLYFHNYQYRFYYGHLGLQIYAFIFLSSYVLIIKDLYIIKKALIIFFIVFISAIFSAQYIFYNIIILIFLFFTMRDKSGINTIKKREFIYLILFSAIFFVLMIAFKYFYFSNYNFNERNWEISDLNKYSIINPLELIFNFKFFYNHIIDFIKSETINSSIKNREIFLKYYTPNGPEFTFFIGIVLTILLIYNHFFKIINYNYSLIVIVIINLIILNNFYPFSLIYLNEYIFPYTRAIQRALIILDFLIILNLAFFFKRYEKNIKLLVLLSFTIIIEKELNFNKSKISVNNNTFLLDKNILGEQIFFYSPSLEHKYIINLLKKNNEGIVIKDTLEDYNMCLVYDDCFDKGINTNNFIISK